MEKKYGNHLIILGLFLIVALSAYLRLSGITWGMKGGYGHYLSFQPDEYISIRGMLPIKPLAGKMRAPDAYFEGTFNYYLWAIPEMLHELWGGVRPMPMENMPSSKVEFILLSGRLMTVAFDLTALILLFAVITEMTGQRLGALFGALLYGIFPMQVIYSHFMRTHVLSNLLCVAVIWLSLKVMQRRRWWLFVITGVVAGLAATTRYPVGTVLSIPCFFLLFQNDRTEAPWPRRLRKAIGGLLTGPLWLLLAGFVIGVFLGEPMLFLDFRKVVDEVSFQTSHYSPPGARNPFDLAPIWTYFSVLVPYATYPLLWVVIYFSALYVILCRRFLHIGIPLCLFVAFYSYPMAKSYINIFARQVMILLPVFCIFAGLAFEDMLPKLLKRRLMFALVMILVVLLVIPTILFDFAYDHAMRRGDVREMLCGDMRELIKDRSTTIIAVSENGAYFYTAMPAVFPLKSNNVAVQLQSSFTAPADFFVMGFERPLAENWRDFRIRQVESGGAFRFMKAYSRAPTILAKRWDLSNFPPDMTYPFPTILLFRNVTSPSNGVEKTDGIWLGVPSLTVPPRSSDVFAKSGIWSDTVEKQIAEVALAYETQPKRISELQAQGEGTNGH
jgi:Dolichyl-phosphate-mannose-protein mannosyltransferase